MRRHTNKRRYLAHYFSNITVVDAVDGQHITAEQDAFNGLYDAALSPGQIGVALSHIQCWQTCLTAERAYLWVLEDDFHPTEAYVFGGGHMEQLIADLTRADPDWHILYNQRFHDFDFFSSVPAGQLDGLTPEDNDDLLPASAAAAIDGDGGAAEGDAITHAGPQLGLVSYAVSLRGARRLLECVEEMKGSGQGMRSPVDVWVHTKCRARSYAVRSPWVEQSGLHFGEQRDMDDQGLTGSAITADNWHEFKVGFGGGGAEGGEGRERSALVRLAREAQTRARQTAAGVASCASND